jgi:hypothetical protein
MNRVLTVLGMHRSGTSMLAGTLREGGLYLGNVQERGIEHNRKGQLEPRAVLFMHEHLLKQNGGSWSNPPEHVTWQLMHQAVRDLFIESRSAHPFWGFKDPRTLFTLDGWRKALPALELVGIFRHPLEVAESLRQRNELDLEAGLALWKAYNARMLAIHRATPFPVIEFHADPGLLRTKLTALATQLKLPRALQAGDLAFFEEGIRRNDLAEAQVPPDVAEVYRQLQAIAL